MRHSVVASLTKLFNYWFKFKVLDVQDDEQFLSVYYACNYIDINKLSHLNNISNHANQATSKTIFATF